jgi:hypothetical protein
MPGQIYLEIGIVLSSDATVGRQALRRPPSWIIWADVQQGTRVEGLGTAFSDTLQQVHDFSLVCR